MTVMHESHEAYLTLFGVSSVLRLATLAVLLVPERRKVLTCRLSPMMSMNVENIFGTFNTCQVDFILIGGMNFLLRHAPILTFDVDLWIDDTAENRSRWSLLSRN